MSEGKMKVVDVDSSSETPAAAAALEQLGHVTKEQVEAEKKRQAVLVEMPPATLREAGVVLELGQLVESKKNHRKDFGDLDELGESMLKQGQLAPLSVVMVNPDVYEIAAGARRFRAAKKVGIQELRCDVYAATPEQAAELRIVENLHRKDLKPIEEAENFAELEKLGYSRATIAKKAGKKVGWVHSRLLLLKLGPKARALVFEGKLPESVAYPLARFPLEQQDRALKGIEDAAGGRAILITDSEGYSRAKWTDFGVFCQARSAIAFLHEEFAKSLKSPSFDVEDMTLNPERGACSSCSDNSDNQPRLEGEEKGKHAFCFDAGCFKKKTEAAWRLTAKAAESKGAEVLSVEDAKGALNGIDYRSSSRYLRATARCDGILTSGIRDPKGRTFAQLVAELPKEQQPTIVVAPDPETKKPIKLYERKDIEAAFAENFSWAKKKAERDSKATPEQNKKADEKRKRQERVSVEVLRQVIAGIRKKAPNVGDLRSIASDLVADSALGGDISDLLEEQGEGDGFASLFGFTTRQQLSAWVEKKAKMPDLIAVLYAFICGDAYSSAFGGFSAEVKEAAARHKLDLKKLEQLDEATAAAEEQKAAEKKSEAKS